MKFSFFLLSIVLIFRFPVVAQEITSKQYREDFDFVWKTVKEEYAYWDKKKTDWDRVFQIYSPQADTISSRKSFVMLMEKVIYELYDHHASLGTNTRESQRLVPTGTDIWAEYENGKPVIKEVRLGSGAAMKGIHAGMTILKFNDADIEKSVEGLIPSSLRKTDSAARNFALRMVLAGKHSEKRAITVKEGNKVFEISPDTPENFLENWKYDGPLQSSILKNNIGYIRINNELGNNDLIFQFDSVLKKLSGTKALILDMRETPSGGNTTVARAILGSFIRKEGFYQKHEQTSEETVYGIRRSWVEIVSPRTNVYTKPLVILVDHWTGSVSEGITIGFDGLKRGKIIGTPMAGLNGAVYSYQMPNSKIWFNFPAEKLYHVNGTPRENFKPSIVVDMTKQKTGQDLILETAMKYLEKS
jgi:C-terminal processing protease CtpA/Prc